MKLQVTIKQVNLIRIYIYIYIYIISFWYLCSILKQYFILIYTVLYYDDARYYQRLKRLNSIHFLHSMKFSNQYVIYIFLHNIKTVKS